MMGKKETTFIPLLCPHIGMRISLTWLKAVGLEIRLNVILVFEKSMKKSITKFSTLRFFSETYYPVDTRRELNVHKTFRRRPGRVLNVLCTFSLDLVSTE